ncbi:hypothetical protein NFI96_013757, partial [Prochilodus magdalenae]
NTSITITIITITVFFVFLILLIPALQVLKKRRAGKGCLGLVIKGTARLSLHISRVSVVAAGRLSDHGFAGSAVRSYNTHLRSVLFRLKSRTHCWMIFPRLPFFPPSDVCKTYGSGVIDPFSKNLFYLKTTCPITLTRFTLLGVNCEVTVQRGSNGLMTKVEILVNKVRTVLQDGNVIVEGNSVSLPFDHTYQHVYEYGIYIRLQSKVLPFTVTWRNHSEGVSSLWVQLDHDLVEGMTGMCGLKTLETSSGQFVNSNINSDGKCVTQDNQMTTQRSEVCEVLSFATGCPGGSRMTEKYQKYCHLNMYKTINENAKCAFFEEVARFCGNRSTLWPVWRQKTLCKQPTCPGDLKYQELGPPSPPTCTNPQPPSDTLTGTCLPPQGKWTCSDNICPSTCNIEGQFVTTFDGKQYSVPGKCTYVAARGLNWQVAIKFSDTDASIAEMYLQVNQDKYTFSTNSVKLGQDEITDLSKTDYATVFWQSSMFVQVQTSFGLKMKVQVSPEIQLYLYLPPTEKTTGLCGTHNNNTEDDFTTSSGIVENAALPFTQSWTVGACSPPDSSMCINTDNEIYGEDKCGQLTNTSSVFARCHDYVPVSTFFDACVHRTCQCTSRLKSCVCVALSNYAKACASQGINVGDWRAETDCKISCNGNLRFSYNTLACNQTCRSLTGPDPICDVETDPVEGCGCLPGTHLNTQEECSPRALCSCYYQGGTTPPGPVVIDGRDCMCENGNLSCSAVCDCPRGKICVHCAHSTVNTAQKTCESLNKPFNVEETCTSGCYCPAGLFEDHNGVCVSKEDCTCEFSDNVYASGQSVETNCKTCVCRGGQWYCEGEPCKGVCEVFGNGQYKTFDSKWYRFDGHCQYTLVEDATGDDHKRFAVRVESVPCCDELLTCSRAISVVLQDEVTLMLRDMNVTQTLKAGWQPQPLYSVHTLGLHIIISVPDLGLTVVWDKHTRVKIILQASWKGKVHGLCGNFDGKVMNDLLTSSSSVVSSPLEFGNSWKTAVPPCSDVTQEVFPCQRHSYCEAWAQRRCMILQSDTFSDCHLKVDPAPFYQACILESCSCEFEGRFLGFCTAVAAYAEACTTQNVCINWRTPDLCRMYLLTLASFSVYCDYYNEESEYGWHYEPCGQMKTCGKKHSFTGRLEGCYPRCPAEMPYFDENTRKCSTLDHCTCYFNNTVVKSGDKVTSSNNCWLVGILLIMLSKMNLSKDYPSKDNTGNPLYIFFATIHSSKYRHNNNYYYTKNTAFCRDPLRNQSWPNGAEWTEDCFYKTCRNDVIEMRPVICPALVQPECHKDLLRLVKDEQGCCDIWQCDCQCELYGDPHYISFSGTTFDFLDNCTYTLVKEKIPQHQLSISVDNYYSSPWLFGSSVKGIILKYGEATARLQLNPENYTVEATLNDVPVQPPFEKNGLRFESTNFKVFVYMDEIRSHVSFDPDNILQITLAMEHFRDNTVGQCGVCGGPSCIRRDGRVESDDCCNKTAYDWIEEDPLKPYCNDAPRDISCVPLNPPAPPPTQPPCEAPICELLRHEVFRECSRGVDVETLVTNCRFDYCVAGKNLICSSLQQLSEQCKRLGYCVYWRNLTEGTCDVTCPQGMIFDECRSTPDDVCQGGIRVPGKFTTDNMRSGCFCPDNKSLAQSHKTFCVSECTSEWQPFPTMLIVSASSKCGRSYCKGPLGEPMPAGAVWESNCHVCTCNNQTLTEDCSPIVPASTPICSADSMLVSGCCGSQTCVERTCEHHGQKYKVGDTWRDRSQPCVSFTCTSSGTEIERSVCPEQNCPEELRVWDKHHCCFSCNITCAVRMSKMTIAVKGCTKEMELPNCGGYCASNSMIVGFKEVLQLEKERRCCREKDYETRQISLTCKDASPIQYTYHHITSCECQPDA